LASLSAITAAPVPEQEQVEARRTMTSNRITYYSGKQLNNPACGGPNPTSHSMIAAVKQGGAFSCGDKVQIQHGSKNVVIKVVDYCESCGHADMDLTTGAFSKLAPISQGEIGGAKVKLM
jgi:hypothetical protein